MKRLIVILMAVVLALSLVACGNEQEAEGVAGTTDKYESVCVDIGVNEDGYYGLIGDVEIHWGENGQPDYFYVDDPTLLAFNVSEERGGGVWVLDLEDGTKAIEELMTIAEVLDEAGMSEVAEKIWNVLDILITGGPYTQAST